MSLSRSLARSSHASSSAHIINNNERLSSLTCADKLTNFARKLNKRQYKSQSKSRWHERKWMSKQSRKLATCSECQDIWVLLLKLNSTQTIFCSSQKIWWRKSFSESRTNKWMEKRTRIYMDKLQNKKRN